VPPAGGTGATVGGTGALVGGAVVVPDVGADEPLDGAGVVVDSTGWLVVALGVGFLVGVAFAAGFFVAVVDSTRVDVRRVVRRGSASVTNTDLTDGLALGRGVGRGGAGGTGFGSRSSPGSGSTALDRTGPPARLTAIRPPYSMTSTPKAYASRRSIRLRRPVLSTKTGAGAGTASTSVSGMSGSTDGEF
jgi:hypothetical protein